MKKEHSTVGFYFLNKSTTHDLFIRGELILHNMLIRDNENEEGLPTTIIDIALDPGKEKLLILDAINRGEEYKFDPKLEFDRK